MIISRQILHVNIVNVYDSISLIFTVVANFYNNISQVFKRLLVWFGLVDRISASECFLTSLLTSVTLPQVEHVF